MRREGRQHGLVLTVEPAACPQPPLRRSRLHVDASNSPATTAFRTRVPARPTNHSKYTGRAPAGVRQQPSSKSRDKSKGARKLRAFDIGFNPKLASWRVTGGSGNWDGWGLAIGGGSASAAAVYLSGYPLDGEEGARWGCPNDEQRWPDDADLEEGEVEMVEVGGGKRVTGGLEEEEEGGGEEGGKTEQEVADDSDGGQEDMDFCEVWYVWDYVDEEDWCVVGEMEMQACGDVNKNNNWMLTA